MNGTGYYVATLSATTGERIREQGLLARGSGDWSFGDGELLFKRYGSSPLIRIPFASIRDIRLGSSLWGGRWMVGSKVALIEWTEPGGRIVVSGFVFSGSRSENDLAVQELKVAVAGQ